MPRINNNGAKFPGSRYNFDRAKIKHAVRYRTSERRPGAFKQIPEGSRSGGNRFGSTGANRNQKSLDSVTLQVPIAPDGMPLNPLQRLQLFDAQSSSGGGGLNLELLQPGVQDWPMQNQTTQQRHIDISFPWAQLFEQQPQSTPLKVIG